MVLFAVTVLASTLRRCVVTLRTVLKLVLSTFVNPPPEVVMAPPLHPLWTLRLQWTLPLLSSLPPKFLNPLPLSTSSFFSPLLSAVLIAPTSNLTLPPPLNSVRPRVINDRLVLHVGLLTVVPTPLSEKDNRPKNRTRRSSLILALLQTWQLEESACPGPSRLTLLQKCSASASMLVNWSNPRTAHLTSLFLTTSLHIPMSCQG